MLKRQPFLDRDSEVALELREIRLGEMVKYVLLLRPKHRDREMYNPWYRARRKRLLRKMDAVGGLRLGRKLPAK